MYIQLELPELGEFPKGFPNYWLNILFTNNRLDTYKIHAIVTTYVRLVEAAMTEYRQARALVHAVWNRNSATVPLGADHRASANFESCLTNMHRAVQCMIRIRSRPDVPQALKDLIPTKPWFTEPRIADRIRDVRHAIQHIEGQVLDGTIPENTPFALRPNGPETPVSDEPGQTLKTIDRLEIGSYEIRFSELCTWLVEMARCAEQISKYERRS